MKWEVKFFKTKRGNFPVKDFIEKLERKTYTRVLRSITLLNDFGPFVRMPISRKITRNLFELRIKGVESIRIFYAQINNRYYLVHVFKKKSQTTPDREIKTALDRIEEIV